MTTTSTTPASIPSIARAIAAFKAFEAARKAYDRAEADLLPFWVAGSSDEKAQVDHDMSLAIRREVAAEQRLAREIRSLTGCPSDRPCSLCLQDGRIVVVLPDSSIPVSEGSLHGQLRGRILIIESDHTS